MPSVHPISQPSPTLLDLKYQELKDKVRDDTKAAAKDVREYIARTYDVQTVIPRHQALMTDIGAVKTAINGLRDQTRITALEDRMKKLEEAVERQGKESVTKLDNIAEMLSKFIEEQKGGSPTLRSQGVQAANVAPDEDVQMGPSAEEAAQAVHEALSGGPHNTPEASQTAQESAQTPSPPASSPLSATLGIAMRAEMAQAAQSPVASAGSPPPPPPRQTRESPSPPSPRLQPELEIPPPASPRQDEHADVQPPPPTRTSSPPRQPQAELQIELAETRARLVKSTPEDAIPPRAAIRSPPPVVSTPTPGTTATQNESRASSPGSDQRPPLRLSTLDSDMDVDNDVPAPEPGSDWAGEGQHESDDDPDAEGSLDVNLGKSGRHLKAAEDSDAEEEGVLPPPPKPPVRALPVEQEITARDYVAREDAEVELRAGAEIRAEKQAEKAAAALADADTESPTKKSGGRKGSKRGGKAPAVPSSPAGAGKATCSKGKAPEPGELPPTRKPCGAPKA
ncbi:unnamed protein product [Peniophora sp. CBMAI 1063]|nr:unnamed protein product [Peniophora sp. CBMAI 1063]